MVSRLRAGNSTSRRIYDEQTNTLMAQNAYEKSISNRKMRTMILSWVHLCALFALVWRFQGVHSHSQNNWQNVSNVAKQKILQLSRFPSFIQVFPMYGNFCSSDTLMKTRGGSKYPQEDEQNEANKDDTSFKNETRRSYNQSTEGESDAEMEYGLESEDQQKDIFEILSAASVFELVTKRMHNHTRELKTKLKQTFLDDDSSSSTWFNWPIIRKYMGDGGSDGGILHADQMNSNRNVSRVSRRRLFLDRIAVMSEKLLSSDNATVDESTDWSIEEADEITAQSDLTRPGRTIHIVTTAALPWMTGTSVNPLLRAAYLCKMTKKINVKSNSQYVTLVLPWLELESDRIELYGVHHHFSSPRDQEDYIRNWMRKQTDLVEEADPETGLRILFYPARYHSGLKSIFAMGDICSVIPEHEASDVCVLEEPEHLNWYRAPGDGWTKKFNYVVGIMHTNYKEYAAGHYSGLWTSPAIGIMSSAMVRAYCHKVVKLSDTLQTYAPEKEQISNVHGVREGKFIICLINVEYDECSKHLLLAEFLLEGRRRALEHVTDEIGENRSQEVDVYFIGKILWAKGFDRLIDLEDFYKQCTGEYFAIDIYGSGPDEDEIKRAFAGRNWKDHLSNEILEEESSSEDEKNSDSEMADQSWTQQKLKKISKSLRFATESIDFDSLPKSRFELLRRNPIPAAFPGRVDHAKLKNYKVFVNPSVSEVLCTTTAEALAMGKFAIIPVHPSNEFFLKFPNCLAYRTKLEFAANLKWALTHEPEPLTPELSFEFTWEAATERFVKAAAITKKESHARAKLRLSKLDERIAFFHNELGKGAKGDALRKVLGGGPISHQVKYEAERQSKAPQVADI